MLNILNKTIFNYTVVFIIVFVENLEMINERRHLIILVSHKILSKRNQFYNFTQMPE